jgi:hypothetical protein
MHDANGVIKEVGLRRWTDKILCAFAVMIIGLVGIVYASVCSDMQQFDSIQRMNVERIVRLEQHQLDASAKLTRIEDKLDQLLLGKTR